MTEGRIRWRQDPYPKEGSHCRCTAKIRIITKPNQKLGMACAAKLPDIKATLRGDQRCRAQYAPTGMPTARMNTRVDAVSSSVAGKRLMAIRIADSPLRIDFPKSKRETSERNLPY